LNEENGCAPTNISGSEPSDFIMIKDGVVVYNPKEVANAKSSIRDLFFSLGVKFLYI
jgi:hypothetical protein